MKTLKHFLILTALLLVATTGYAKSKIITESSGVHCGVRYYMGQLPEDIEYKSLGKIEARGRGGMAAEVLMNSVLDLCMIAKEKGANAVINVKWGEVGKGEAIIAEKFPDEYTEADFEGFKGPKEYSKNEVFKHSYDAIFYAIVSILKDELYDLAVIDYENGIIETQPTEVDNGKRGAMRGGSYPVMKLVINIKDMGGGETEVTENYIFLKGMLWDDSVLKKSNKTFFKDIRKKTKAL